jgi:DNA-directed RNA polymerase subunit RPC12/RpoP
MLSYQENIMSKNGAGFDPAIEDVPTLLDNDRCEDCGGQIIMKQFGDTDEIYYKCVECGNTF